MDDDSPSPAPVGPDILVGAGEYEGRLTYDPVRKRAVLIRPGQKPGESAAPSDAAPSRPPARPMQRTSDGRFDGDLARRESALAFAEGRASKSDEIATRASSIIEEAYDPSTPLGRAYQRGEAEATAVVNAAFQARHGDTPLRDVNGNLSVNTGRTIAERMDAELDNQQRLAAEQSNPRLPEGHRPPRVDDGHHDPFELRADVYASLGARASDAGITTEAYDSIVAGILNSAMAVANGAPPATEADLESVWGSPNSEHYQAAEARALAAKDSLLDLIPAPDRPEFERLWAAAPTLLWTTLEHLGSMLKLGRG